MRTKTKVLILAGGKSERFWPFKDKSLFCFLGKPLVARQIERVKKLVKNSQHCRANSGCVGNYHGK